MLRSILRLACAVVLLAGVMVTPAAAQTPDKRTLFTFSGPVSMPGLTLPAGQYLFRLADPYTSGRVVQVLSADGTKPYGLFFAYSAERFDAADKPEVRFMETAKGTPAAIKTWWYPGERTGYEFIYPKDQARKLAQAASLPVLTTQATTTTTEQTNASELARVSSTGEETNLTGDTKPAAATPAGTTQEGTVASESIAIPNATVPAVAQASHSSDSSNAVSNDGKRVARTGRTHLPGTASMTPTIAAIGTIALLGGIGLWGGRRRARA